MRNVYKTLFSIKKNPTTWKEQVALSKECCGEHLKMSKGKREWIDIN
ncbi:MAG: hypothetical protein IPJ43_06345 [Saprospiraceae bacterium]|nr:hypothetical protein [Saprospiraceae bacterium]